VESMLTVHLDSRTFEETSPLSLHSQTTKVLSISNSSGFIIIRKFDIELDLG